MSDATTYFDIASVALASLAGASIGAYLASEYSCFITKPFKKMIFEAVSDNKSKEISNLEKKVE